MATSDARNLITKFNCDIASSTSGEDLTCVLCKKLLMDAYQTYCGCQYCYPCIKNYLADRTMYCCGNREGCNDELLVLDKNVTRNAIINRKLTNLKVICPNDTCSHRSELTKLEEHLRMCPKQPIECPYLSIGCDNERAPKDTISSHLNIEALSHAHLLMEFIQNVKNDSKEDSSKIDKRIQALEEILNNKTNRIAVLEEESIFKENKIKTMEKEFQHQMSKMMEKITGISNEYLKLREESRDNKNTFVLLSKQLSVMKDEMRLRCAQKEVISQNQNITSPLVGSITLVIDKFNQRKSMSGAIYSPYFYSHSNGYKIRLQIYPGGYNGGDNQSGKGKCMSVFVIICKGEFDDKLSWPCEYIFLISIINQKTGQDFQKRELELETILLTSRYKFDRPITDENDCCGYSTFIYHEDLESIDGLLINDCAVIKCVVYPKTTFIYSGHY